MPVHRECNTRSYRQLPAGGTRFPECIALQSMGKGLPHAGHHKHIILFPVHPAGFIRQRVQLCRAGRHPGFVRQKLLHTGILAEYLKMAEVLWSARRTFVQTQVTDNLPGFHLRRILSGNREHLIKHPALTCCLHPRRQRITLPLYKLIQPGDPAGFPDG